MAHTHSLIHANTCIGTHAYEDYKMATSVLNSLKAWLSNWNFHHCGELECCRLRVKLSWAVAGPLDNFSSLASVWLLCKFSLRWYEPYSSQTGQQQQTKNYSTQVHVDKPWVYCVYLQRIDKDYLQEHRQPQSNYTTEWHMDGSLLLAEGPLLLANLARSIYSVTSQDHGHGQNHI